MRLIDADSIPRFGGRKGLVHSADIDALPTIDAVPVVRCRDCYLGIPIKFADGSDMIACEFDGGITRFPDFYCKAGARKDDDENG